MLALASLRTADTSLTFCFRSKDGVAVPLTRRIVSIHINVLLENLCAVNVRLTQHQHTSPSAKLIFTLLASPVVPRLHSVFCSI